MRPKQYDARIEVRWPEWLMTWVRSASKVEQRTLSNFVRVAVTDYLRRNYSELKPDAAESDEALVDSLRRSHPQTHGCGVQQP